MVLGKIVMGAQTNLNNFVYAFLTNYLLVMALNVEPFPFLPAYFEAAVGAPCTWCPEGSKKYTSSKISQEVRCTYLPPLKIRLF